MKKSILFFAFTLIVNLTFGQNVLYLKNGDKINGKFEGYKKDTIIFNLQGNKLKYSSKVVSAIYFDQLIAPKNITNSIELNKAESKQEGKIYGVITYFFNKNYGDKPDVGAKVFIVDSSKVSGFDISLLDSFHYGNSYRQMYLSYKSMKMDVPIEVMNQVKKYNVENKTSFDSLDYRTYRSVFGKIQISKYVKETVIDGVGNYSLNVLPGTYYVYIKSNNRKGSSITEISGKVRCFKIIVKDGNETNVSYNFGLY
jgi:hypothetical protein